MKLSEESENKNLENNNKNHTDSQKIGEHAGFDNIY